jgi:hypothetical protein
MSSWAQMGAKPPPDTRATRTKREYRQPVEEPPSSQVLESRRYSDDYRSKSHHQNVVKLTRYALDSRGTRHSQLYRTQEIPPIVPFRGPVV